MIVIAIITVLAAILVPNWARSKEQAKVTACRENLANMAKALETYSIANERQYPATLEQVVAFGYLATLPTCPSAQNTSVYTNGYEVYVNEGGFRESYTLYCSTANHTGVGLPANRPLFSPTFGLKDN
jgi:type II secretory pathway pseudopilin PulG